MVRNKIEDLASWFDYTAGALMRMRRVSADVTEENSVVASSQVKLYPGMAVEAAIITGKRPMLAFLLQPSTESFARAFREG